MSIKTSEGILPRPPRVRANYANRKLVATRGTPEQKQLLEAGFLSHDEILCLAREVAFLTFEGMPRYVRFEHTRHDRDRRTRNPLPHAEGCSRPEPTFDTIKQETLDQFQHAAYHRFEAAAARTAVTWRELELAEAFVGISLEPRLHTGVCPECGGHLERMAVLVKVRWVGQELPLSREYAL
jgi:hypothetical protein